ncbi:ribonuclease H-like domain-containing protein [Armillaria luteobubalina]|uniref:ribonuclease H n=1 Tax=Armillaria luteobubalina TaxID=153913 RepID=A0AA39PTS2_9AGAR|nr:ribonuclease H-like domain-containing protein [Armillaria luteobubalina]
MDGSAYGNGTANARAGAGVWFSDSDDRNIHIQLLGPNQTNNTAEIRAVLERVLAAVNNESITMISDSKYIIEGLCFHLKCWEDNGWMGMSNSDIWKATAAALHKRGAPIYFWWVKGHNGNRGNEGADTLSEEGAALGDEYASPADTEICHEFDVDGACLAALTQSQVYNHIRVSKRIKTRDLARNTTQRVIATIQEINGVEPIEQRLWRSVRNKDVSRPIRGFLWKALQNTFKIGSFWEHLGPQYASRGECPECKTMEDMEHILIDCTINGHALLWDLARELQEGRGQEWIPLSYGSILGATLKGDVDPVATWLYRIMMTKTMHLIWKIHCQRRIQRVESDPSTWHSLDEVRNLWIDTMNKRLMIDRLLVNRQRYDTRALRKVKVLSTWKGTLLNKKSLLEDWIDQSRVLVGMVLVQKQPRGRHRAPH